MKSFYDEVGRRFPELRGARFDENVDAPTILMSMLVAWLGDLPPAALNEEVIARVRAFFRWCSEQPDGESAGKDVSSVLLVGFFENLFDREQTRRLFPLFMSHQDFVFNAEYFKKWVGEEKYEFASEYYR